MKKDTQRKILLEQLKRTPIVQIACEKTGVGRATYYRWRKESAKFLKQADNAISEGLLLMNDMAESQLLGAIKDKNMTAVMFWLKHHHSTYKTRVELSGKVDMDGENLTKEQRKTIREALKLGLFQSNLTPLQTTRYEHKPLANDN